MDILFLLMLAAALVHFIYEGIIAPSLRMRLRNEMFVLRDELRALKITDDDRCSDDVFAIAHNGINQYINRLHWLTISFMADFTKAHRNPEFRKEVKRRRDLVSHSPCHEVQHIVLRGNKVLENAFFVNSAITFAYFVPIILVIELLASAKRKLFARVHTKVSEVFATPPGRTATFFPAALNA